VEPNALDGPATLPSRAPSTEVPAAPAADALHHFSRLLQLETDCWDVHASLQNGGFVLLALLVVYCDGPHCNGADRAAIRLASLGRPVKKMIGGITGWIDEGFPLIEGP